MLSAANYPLLIHDDTGKSSSSLLCALVRVAQGWSVTGAFMEGDGFCRGSGGEGGGVGEAGREVSPG